MWVGIWAIYNKIKTVESFDTQLLYFEIEILIFYEKVKTNNYSHKFAIYHYHYVLLTKYFLLSIGFGQPK